ncbi:MAG: SDR family NAD(P)-dependent oxidoreductase [Saprospiraceae bacterium]|nr:SDR family NAD(P)-dependent oxidoreductase [Saprospiraceae bacterium]MCB9325446.1 SDR family NAD(P)-dependent oxidoreductase [Lewinellaceae bacterium]
MSSFDLNKVPSKKDSIAIVTGANIGLGYETTIGLAKKQIKVIMACRNKEKAENARKEILQKVPGADLGIILLDLGNLESVRNFASSFQEKYNRLDLLINNAGIMIPPFSKTTDGFESQIGVNYLGHFLLTGLLMPLLEKTASSRIVTLSSIAHRNGVINFDDLNSEKSYSKMTAYGQSKVACLMFAYEMQRRLEAKGSKVISVASHPGVSNTNLSQYAPAWFKVIGSLLLPFFMHAPEKAALPSLYAALGEDVKGGDYFGPTGFREMKGAPGKVSSSTYSSDKDIAKRLWDVSQELTGIKYL